MSIPERLGKYPISEVIGKGAMGIVYRGYDPVIKRPVAIKTIRKELIDDDDKSETLSGRFRREAQAAGTLNHPGIVSVYEYGEDAQYAYIAMEYVEGSSLREYLSNGSPFDEHDSVSVMAQLLDALQFAHDHAVWHRDIKPANILVMSNGRIKLTDFGIARIESADRTKTNIIMGTPGYIAPEMYLSGQIDHRVDIFSAGVLFYNLLAGQPPFRGRSEAVMYDVCYHDPPPPSTIDPNRRWTKYDAVVARALEKKPENRYQSAAAFRAAILAEYAEPLNSTLSDATIVSPKRPIVPDAGAPSLPKTTAVAGTSTPPPTGWSAAVLSGVEVELARFLGPVARVLVRRAAKNHKDIDTLTAALIESIERQEDKDAFVRAVTGKGLTALRSRVPTGNETPLPVTPTPGPTLTPEELERATKLLTTYIGPIARVIAKRAAANGASRHDFFNQVAQSLESDALRERFLREAAVTRG
ncbi:serine/threonine-protein kinase [Piscinibacter sp. XHJ-5]|uniref:serine/threonine-protein kinase n=1 Tax=Piscinibacter sp. XHJ-5 TaxID=3037797 RepID=UPI00245371E0|nr:serine/threonine-protein kinase [Piscinibacter sp. XHJ-5]